MLRLLKLTRMIKPVGLPVAFVTSQVKPKNVEKKVYPRFDPLEYTISDVKQDPFTMVPREYPYDADIFPLRMPEIKTRILRVLSKFEKVALTEHFNWKGKFDEDHGLDSLDVIAIITSIEEEFHTVFEDAAFDNLQTFDDVADFLTTLHNAF